MKVIEIGFVGYSVTDLKRARHFYEGVLGLEESRTFGNENKAWVEYDIGPGTLAITNMMPEWKPSPDGGIAALEVEDFDAAVSRLRENNVTMLYEPFETPACHMVIITDPDGNAITVHKRKA